MKNADGRTNKVITAEHSQILCRAQITLSNKDIRHMLSMYKCYITSGFMVAMKYRILKWHTCVFFFPPFGNVSLVIELFASLYIRQAPQARLSASVTLVRVEFHVQNCPFHHSFQLLIPPNWVVVFGDFVVLTKLIHNLSELFVFPGQGLDVCTQAFVVASQIVFCRELFTHRCNIRQEGLYWSRFFVQVSQICARFRSIWLEDIVHLYKWPTTKCKHKFTTTTTTATTYF